MVLEILPNIAYISLKVINGRKCCLPSVNFNYKSCSVFIKKFFLIKVHTDDIFRSHFEEYKMQYGRLGGFLGTGIKVTCQFCKIFLKKAFNPIKIPFLHKICYLQLKLSIYVACMNKTHLKKNTLLSVLNSCLIIYAVQFVWIFTKYST